jgi:hypothetical protein
MFVRLLLDRDDPESLIVINVHNIRYIVPRQDSSRALPKCDLCFAYDHAVTVDHEFDYVASLLEEATGSLIKPIPKPPARPAPPNHFTDMLPSKSRDNGRI